MSWAGPGRGLGTCPPARLSRGTLSPPSRHEPPGGAPQLPCPREVPRVPGGELRDCSLCPVRSGPFPGGEPGRGAPGHRQVSGTQGAEGRGTLPLPRGRGEGEIQVAHRDWPGAGRNDVSLLRGQRGGGPPCPAWWFCSRRVRAQRGAVSPRAAPWAEDRVRRQVVQAGSSAPHPPPAKGRSWDGEPGRPGRCRGGRLGGSGLGQRTRLFLCLPAPGRLPSVPPGSSGSFQWFLGCLFRMLVQGVSAPWPPAVWPQAGALPSLSPSFPGGQEGVLGGGRSWWSLRVPDN